MKRESVVRTTSIIGFLGFEKIPYTLPTQNEATATKLTGHVGLNATDGNEDRANDSRSLHGSFNSSEDRSYFLFD